MKYLHKLNFVENMALCNLITTEYETSKLDDVKFAEYAKDVLKIDKITSSHIGNRRGFLKIPSNVKRAPRESKKISDNSSLEKRVAELEEKLALLCESLGVKAN